MASSDILLHTSFLRIGESVSITLCKVNWIGKRMNIYRIPNEERNFLGKHEYIDVGIERVSWLMSSCPYLKFEFLKFHFQS
jgi:hypothetical protein